MQRTRDEPELIEDGLQIIAIDETATLFYSRSV
jgi:hypothetical protein